MENEKHSPTFMEKVAAFIIDKRKAFYLVFLISVVFCVISIPKVKINNDLSVYLPAGTETRQGLEIMAKEFTTYANAQVMVSNITYEKALSFANSFARLKGVMSVTFDNTPSHYVNSSALIMVSFAGEASNPKVVSAMSEIKSALEGYDVSYNSEVGNDFSKSLASEMAVILGVAVLVIIAVLLITSKSYLELLIFFIVFAVAGILNMGTNFFFGEISFVTNAIAIILQLALAVDYAIILCHRYMEERTACSARDACIKALSKAIVEISSSSLTTIAGLLALTTMQFRIGFDMGIVLIKGIFCSLITVFLLMPGLIMMLNRGIERTRHRSFVPSVAVWGRFIVKTRYVLMPIFIVVLIGGVFLSNKCDYVFSMNGIDTKHPSEARIAQDKIADTFGTKNTIALVVPLGDYESEKAIIKKVSELPEIVGALGLANVEVDDTHVLTDKLTPRQFAELADIDIELSRLLYRAYGLASKEYSAVFQDVDDYSAPLIKVFRFLVEQRDAGVVGLTDEQNEKIDTLNATLSDALVQLEGETRSRIVFTADVPDEGEATVALLEKIKSLAQPYYHEDVLIVSNATLALDLNRSFTHDNLKISILTALFVMVILLFTFKSIGLPFMLILTIQGSIFINFSFPYLTNTNLFFLSYLIVSAIQMGATIDYAILITNRYQTLKSEMDRKSAIITGIDQSFPTIFTSGTILTVAGYLIAMLSTEPIINSIGLALGRGTLISIILVLTVLPQILYVGDTIIQKSALTLHINHIQRVHTDEMRMDGHVRGTVSGYIDGEFKGVIRGSINAAVESHQPPNIEIPETDETESDINE
ncbi:MAG: MMPL family transporter [Oscillospiraceae bacterium]